MVVNIFGRQPAKQVKRDIEVVDENKVYGLKYPVSNSKRGLFPKQSGLDLVKANLTQLLRTEKGERVMLPNFGCSLKQYLFEPLDQNTFRLIQSDILTAINTWMPTVEVAKISVLTEDKILANGGSGIKIILVVRLEEFQNNLTEIEVNLV
jgi:phage baseplate assembly protein W